MLSFAVICFLHAFEAKVSPQEQQARWSLVYRLLPAEAGKKHQKCNIKFSFFPFHFCQIEAFNSLMLNFYRLPQVKAGIQGNSELVVVLVVTLLH